MSDEISEEFQTLKEADAFIDGLTYGDETNWVGAHVELIRYANEEAYRVYFRRPDDYDDESPFNT